LFTGGAGTRYASKRQFTYKAFQNEAAGEGKHSHSDPTSPQTEVTTAETSLTMTNGGLTNSSTTVKETMLIDLSDEQNRKESIRSKHFQADALSILDSSVAEKYQCLPPPISEQAVSIEDPFIIKTDLNQILGRTPTSKVEYTSSSSSSPGIQDGSSWSSGSASQLSPSCRVQEQRIEVYMNVSNGHSNTGTGPMLSSTNHVTSTNCLPLPPRQMTNLRMSSQMPTVLQSSSQNDYGSNLQNGVTKQQVDKAFDWLNDAVAGFSLTKPQDKTIYSNVSTNAEDKDALETWDNKTLLPIKTSPVHELNNALGVGARRKEYGHYFNLPQHDSSTCANREQETMSGSQVPPPIPPRDYRGHLEPPMPQHPNKHYSNIPVGSRIHPVMQDGVQTTYTHYWLLPEHNPNTSQSECSSGGASASADIDNDYQNVDDSSGAGNLILGVDILGQENPAFTHSISMESSQPRTGTGTSAIYKSTDLINKPSQPAPTPKSPTSTGPAFGNPREKIEQVQKQVHGITEDESLAALNLKHWSVSEAVRYLKVEQLFRLGVASKERCQKLLETFDWNLQMAGSILLDELSMGSAV